ncbi:hypothetical protein JD844_010793 [Phrynosoma platyrhinos]|uniref:Sterol O-acyltransferase 2 n=1 Tax=Phrynosoma platyrhinos TaxID=52577 RepID=A0ABQ7TH07_PHRPL|nr:hypothetical protein JD844_010793 [Phrynosoma platyrhinos]
MDLYVNEESIQSHSISSSASTQLTPALPHTDMELSPSVTQFLGCVFYGSYILKCLCIPVFSNINKEPFTLRTLVISVSSATLPGIYVMLMICFSFFHCWLNAFAEMLRFADRTFYKDWWNSTSYSVFYRTWNVVVHDWLYYYIYQDFLWVGKGWKNHTP